MPENLGEQFLHQQNPELHKSEYVQHEKERLKRAGKEVSQKPAEEIANWMKLLERTHLGHRDDPEVLNRIKESYHKKYLIKPEDIPESYFDNQRRIARELGYGDIEITDEMKQEAAETIRADQKATLDLWLDYFLSPDSDSYPMWAKYWAFEGMTKLGSYDKEKHVFSRRDKNTVAPYPDLNREALAYVLDAIIKKANQENIPLDQENPEFQKLLQGANFGKLYSWAIEKVTPTEENELLEIRGKWVKYPQGSDPTPLVESLQGHGTGWCTVGEHTARKKLQKGDFYVYYSYDKNGKPTIPRIAIRMEGKRIAEVMGIAHEQNLDPQIAQTDILTNKLKEFDIEGKRYQKRSDDMKKLTEIEKKHKQGISLSKEELRFLYEIDEEIIEGFGLYKDPRIEEIIEQRNIRKDLAFALDCTEEEISLTKEEALKGGIKYHYGYLDLRYFTSAKDLTLPESVGGGLYLDSLTSAEGLILPKSIRGGLVMRSLTSAKGVIFPESMSIGGSLDLSSLTSAEDLTLPDSVGRDVNLRRLISAKGLILPKSIGGELYLNNLTSAEDLTLPDSVGWHVYLGSLTYVKGPTLPKSTRPKSIGGDLYLNSLTSAEGLILQESIGGDLDLSRLTSAEGLTLPKSIGGNLYLRSLTSAKGLILPKSIGRDLFLDSLTSAEDLILPESIGGHIYLYSLDDIEKDKLKQRYPQLADKII
ncbi:MAG TPA: hypothetical protein PK119_02015 [Candidatus Paceibacterota bacterium]|nr:hypothetical protein [Candidatus Paceibacterota bacterium]